uniref:non-specific serine/threonine protein kinase n=1 Tax=Oryza glaberrima TaxID=4538 RepID=I1Q7T2_ORYGL
WERKFSIIQVCNACWRRLKLYTVAHNQFNSLPIPSPAMKYTFLLFLCLASFVTCSEHQFVFSGFTGSNLVVDGAATITEDGLLELTNGANNIEGHAFYPTPLRFRKSPNGTVQSFSVSFVFSILQKYANRSNDGMAFFIAPSKNFSDASLPAQYLGLLNNKNNGNRSNDLFAVELDTFQNKEFQDMDDNHVGINVNSMKSLDAHYAGFYEDRSGIFRNLTLVIHEAMQVWFDYDGDAKKINVTLAPAKLAKPKRPLLSVTYDLSTVVADSAYIGFSAATGGVVNTKHCVLGWSFRMNGPAQAIDISRLPKLPNLGSKKSHSSRILVIISPVATAVLIFLVGVLLVLCVRRRLKYRDIQEDWEVEFGPHRFSYKVLYGATEGFKDKNLLGVGGFGKVYKGVLPVSKQVVAVKCVSHESSQGMKEFVAEIVSIGQLRHRNLVQLFGYCRRKGELLLVYDYMSNGSLDNYLYCDLTEPTLDWAQRFNIVKGVTSGLLYLHEKWGKIVIHRDIKASNVLLDKDMNARLGDFGLSRLYDHGTDPQTTHLVGTMGYLAPELVFTGKASPATDIFAFGVFLLEVTCGQRPLNNNQQDNQPPMLVDWILEHWQKGLLPETVDKRLQGNYNVDEACLVLKLGLLCSHPIAMERPTMSQVQRYLDGDAPLPELAPSELKFNMVALMQGQGFDSYVLPCLSLSSVVSIETSPEVDDDTASL